MEKILRINDLGRTNYGHALEIQRETARLRREGAVEDTLILTEHDPVYTLGRNAKESNILDPNDGPARSSIEVVRTDRGGDVTYHGPGQLVGYPIIMLRGTGQGPVWYVSSIEKTLISVLAGLGIDAVADSDNRGVWVGNDKIAAIGVRISRGVTMHGFALNVAVNLDHYSGIIPCGIRGKGVTSIDKLGQEVSMDEAKKSVAECFADIFNYEEVRIADEE